MLLGQIFLAIKMVIYMSNKSGYKNKAIKTHSLLSDISYCGFITMYRCPHALSNIYDYP